MYSIREESEGMAGHEEFKDKPSQEDVTKREGPFKIDEVLGPVTYQLKLPESWKIHNVFHATLLRPYIKNKVYGNNYPRPLPELLEGDEVYEVEMILKHWRRGRGYRYYVKWKGYPITEATWEN
jgi:Chromo (CHRromatin Organisation MOdifier) domain